MRWGINRIKFCDLERSFFGGFNIFAFIKRYVSLIAGKIKNYYIIQGAKYKAVAFFQRLTNLRSLFSRRLSHIGREERAREAFKPGMTRFPFSTFKLLLIYDDFSEQFSKFILKGFSFRNF